MVYLNFLVRLDKEKPLPPDANDRVNRLSCFKEYSAAARLAEDNFASSGVENVRFLICLFPAPVVSILFD